MLNFRICGIAAGAALVFSLILGLVNGTHFPALLIRAVVFGMVFFALFCLIFLLVNRFVPELLSGGTAGGPSIPTGQGNGVSAASSGPGAGAFPSGGSDDAGDEVDDIDSKVFASVTTGLAQQDFSLDGDASSPSASRGLDQKGEGKYNAKGDGAAQPAGDDQMPDFDALSEAFSPNAGSDEAEQDGGMDSVLDDMGPKSGSKKKDALKGDFNAKELAQAIQTVLKKDEQK